MTINRQNNHLFLTATSLLLWFGLFVIRIGRVVFGLTSLALQVESVIDVVFIASAFIQDLIFVFLIWRFAVFISDRSSESAGLNIPLRIVHVLFSEFLWIGGLMDYSYYKTCGHSATVAKLSITGTHFFDLSDSFFAYTTAAAVVFGVVMIVFIAAGGLLSLWLVGRNDDWDIDIASISFLQNVPVWITAAVFYVVLCCFTHSVGMAKQNEIASQPLVRLLASFSELGERGDKAEEAENPTVPQNIGSFRKFSRDSATQPLSVMDRQIIESVRNNIPKQKKDYNIVLYLSESTFAGYYPMYNDNTENVGVSPFIESKMDNTLLLRHNYTTGVRSINSLISLLTGIAGYPGYKEINSLNDYLETPALSQIMAKRGYRSALVHGGNFYFYNKLRFLNNRDFDFMIDAAELKKKYPSAMSNSWGIDDRLLVREGLEWIDKQLSEKKHFTLTLVPIAPHHPYEVPAEVPHFIAKPKNDYEAYLNSLMFVDEIFRQLWEGLESRGVLDDTIIVFTADHGEAFGQHKGNNGHENHIYEENVRTPCMFFNPKLFQGYNQIDTVTNLSDIFPTLLEILGEDIPPMCQGESILSRNTGKYSFFACGERNVDIGLIDGHYKAVYDYINNRMSLYDLNNEMFDNTDISAAESRLTVGYKKIITDYYGYQKNFLENFNEIAEKIRLSEHSAEEVSLLDMTPFFKSQDKYAIRKNVDHEDKPIKILEKVYPKGYGVHANSNMQFDLKNLGFTRFKGLAGKLDVPSWRQNFLEMRIYADGVLKFTTGLLTTDDPPVSFDIDIEGAETLELMVLDGGDNDRYDGAAWIEPVLVRE